MKKESDSRKRRIAAAICEAGIHALVYDAGRERHELVARRACLSALIQDAATSNASLVVLERDDSLARWDNQALIEITRDLRCRETLLYDHRRAQTEQLLAIPDAIAWCWGKGGPWRRRVEQVVWAVRSV